MAYTNREYFNMLLALGEARGRAGAAVRIYRDRWPRAARHPDANVIRALERHCLETDALVHRRNVDGGRRVANRRNVAVQERILQCVENDPTRSTRSVARQLGTSHVTVWRTLHEDEQHPYHYTNVHDLQPRDPPQRLLFCQEMINCAAEDPTFVDRILWTDESIFTRDGYFNQHNSHFWSHENPHVTHVNSFQHRFSVNMWAGLVGDQVVSNLENQYSLFSVTRRSVKIGPIIFPDRLDGDSYLDFLQNRLPELLEDLPLNLRDRLVYQHDGAPPHFSIAVRDHLDREFPDRWIGRRGPMLWPPRSPDLTPLDFFLWGHMKAKVYEGDPIEDIDELTRRIRRVAAEIPNAMIQRATRSTLDRARMCVDVQGQHLEQFR